MTVEVLVLAGGPDAEREVSLAGGRAVAKALEASARFASRYQEVGKLDAAALAKMTGEVVFPVLHGPWGEGGPLQELLEADGRPFVGSSSRAAAVAINKAATKELARAMGLPTLDHVILSAEEDTPALDLPVIIKPIDDGSSVDLYLCRSASEVEKARSSAHVRHERLMIESFVDGRELTVGIIADKALPVLEIKPAEGMYDYDAKYNRDDTVYDLEPNLPGELEAELRRMSERLFAELGCRHIARVDWLLDSVRGPVLLEINTMPGFTSHSLVPMAARRVGLDMQALCEELARLALADHYCRG